MSSEADSNWYLFTAVGRVGPLTLREVRDLASRGALRPQDLAWCPGMPEWKKVREVDVLRVEREKEITKESAPIIVVDPVAAATSAPGPAIAPEPKAEEETPRSPPLSAIDQLAITNFESVELDRPISKDHVSSDPTDNPSERARPHRYARKKKHSFRLRLPKFSIPKVSITKLSFPKPSKKAAISIASAITLGSLAYYAYPLIGEWLSPFPKIQELADDQYKLLKDAAHADLKKQGPKVEMASSPRNDGGSTFYVATNLTDQTAFDLIFVPIVDTLVGEPRDIQPLHIATKQHLAIAGIETVPPGYYWATLTTPAVASFSIHRRVFLGGVPDLNYQTHLSDYVAVRRGIAKAELDRIKDAISKVDALVSAENKAAESLSVLKIPQAKAQAWDIFQETWTRGFNDIQALLARPARYSGKLLIEAQGVQEPLKKLHDKHHEMVSALVTPASRQLSRGTVATARVFADAQAITNQISAQTKELNSKIDERQKLFSNPLFPITEEP